MTSQDAIPADVAEDWRRFAPSIESAVPPVYELLRDTDGDVEMAVAAMDDEERRVRVLGTALPRYVAALLVLRDLLLAGWQFRLVSGAIEVRPLGELAETDTKEAVRRQLLAGRADQFRVESVRRFVEDLEHPRSGARDSIASLIARGADLSKRLRPLAAVPRELRADALREVCKPYLCFAERGAKDPHTGIDLFDAWRYFRYTWTSRYRRSPGRHIPMLIRDAAQPQHPVIAIAALSNAVVQLGARDAWIGWTIDGLQDAIARGEVTASEALLAVRGQIQADLQTVYAGDLGFDPAHPPLLDAELERALTKLEKGAALARRRNLAEGASTEKVEHVGEANLTTSACTPLFLAKRAAAARRLLRARTVLGENRDLESLVSSPDGRWALEFALRQIKQYFVSSAVMEITTCGAVPPYGPLLGGKLACLLMMSPEIPASYATKYGAEASIIASQMAGRPIVRRPNLVLLCTSSLYPERSSQYNRVRLPVGTIPGQIADIRFLELGRTRGHGATSFGLATEEALALLSEELQAFRNVNYVFGEGQSAKMRQTREGLEALGLHAADLIRHGTKRLIYGVPLITNAARYLLGVDPSSRRACPDLPGASEQIAEYWRTRWLASRVDHAEALAAVEAHEPEHALISRAWRQPKAVQRRLL